MSESEIPTELPRMTASETDSLAEKQAREKALAEFACDPCPGEPWHRVLHEIRESRR